MWDNFIAKVPVSSVPSYLKSPKAILFLIYPKLSTTLLSLVYIRPAAEDVAGFVPTAYTFVYLPEVFWFE